MSLEISGLAHAIVNDTAYARLQAKAFREISITTNDEQGAAKGARLFLEFLEREAEKYNPTEELAPKKTGVKKASEPVVHGPQPPVKTTTSHDPDLDSTPELDL